jgi:glyoxylase-like metal-dependent hydrolase (beta-lactamase superfamily II)
VCPKGFRAVEPDVLVDDELSLKGYGLEGTIVHAPGHTAGSLMILLSSGEVLVGDQVRGASAELSLGRFYEDRGRALKSLERVILPTTGRIYMSHGTHTDAGSLAGFIEKHNAPSGAARTSSGTTKGPF